MNNPQHHRHLLILSVLWLLGLVITGYEPFDRGTWVLEVFPAVLAWPILWFTRQRFPLTTLLYYAICLHGLVLMLGGMYTYARVPLGFELQAWFGFERNPYDRIGHFFQGFVPALVAREILLRGQFVRTRGMLNFVIVSMVMFVSSFYELIEWWAALLLGGGAVDFLGTQGDPWDTQSDMFFALVGAVCCLLLMARWHDRQLKAIS
ncbi:MAG: DUF2238 domain-containing protein [Gammaproteobacteria bacterium]|jgi:putative membrane protein